MINSQLPFKKTNTAVYPKYTSLIRDNKRLETFLNKLEENPVKSNIIEHYTEIDNQIQVFNISNISVFKTNFKYIGHQ